MTMQRAELFEQVILELSDPALTGVLVRGGAGLGKTQLGHRCVNELAATFDATWVIGQRLLEHQPFAIFEALLPSVPTMAAENHATAGMNLVQALYEHLQDKGAALGKGPLLIVDNAQWIDKDSCAVLEQLAVSGAVRMLLLCRPGYSDVAQSALFSDDTMFAQYALPLLTAAEVLAGSEARLGGKIVPGAAAVLADLSGGHPLFLQVILDAAMEQHAFVRHGNIWALSAAPTETAPNVSDIAMDLFNECSADEQNILEAVALAEPLSATLLHRLFPNTEHGALMESHTLRASPGAASTVQFSTPVFGQSLRERIPVGRSVDIRRRVLEARASLPMSSSSLMRHIGWSFDCGAHVPQRSLLHAARLANSHNEPQLAFRLATAVQDPRYTFQARLESVLATIKLQQFSQGTELLKELGREVGTKAECDSIGTLAVMLAALEGYPADKLDRLARRWRETYGILGLADCAGADLVEALIVIRAGYSLPDRSRDTLLGICASEEHVGLQFAAAALLAHAAVVQGDHPGAERDFTRARSLLFKHPGWLGLFRNVIVGQHMLFLVSVGCADRALKLLDEDGTETAADGCNTEIHGLVELVRALADLEQGNMAAAVAGFDVAIAALLESDPVFVLPYAFASAAYAHHLAGNDVRAAALAQDYHRATHNDSVPMWLLSKAYLSAAGLDDGKRKSSFESLFDLAEQARIHGAAAVELSIHNVMLRAGCTDHLQRMLAIKVDGIGPAVPMMRAMARALLAGDADALEDVATMPGAEQNKLLAVEALGHALRLHVEQGHHDGRVSVLTRLRSMNFPFQATGSPAIAELAATAELTSREREIAVLVHRRHSNRDIAEKFTLSQRTIEGHLYKIYSKLGVGSREELYQPWLPELLSTADK